jgi:hypothetical protein
MDAKRHFLKTVKRRWGNDTCCFKTVNPDVQPISFRDFHLMVARYAKSQFHITYERNVSEKAEYPRQHQAWQSVFSTNAESVQLGSLLPSE